MPRIYVEFSGLKQVGNDCKIVASKIKTVQSNFQSTVRQLDWDIRFEADINNTAMKLSRKLESYSRVLKTYQDFISNISEEYTRLDEYRDENKFERFKSEFWSNYGWGGILAGAGEIGVIYSLLNDAQKCKSWKDFLITGKRTGQFLSETAKTYNNYKKIGNAVGTKTAMGWWVKKITGFKPLGRASTAKNPFTRFAHNLTNKTSPFHTQWKNIADNFKGVNGMGKAIASWGSVAVTGVFNWFSNKEERANSNGAMSDKRVVAETVTETVVDTVLTYGSSIVVGAAVTAVTATAAPGILVVAASGAIVTGLNVGAEALTGKTSTEWISDAILNTGEAFGNTIRKTSQSRGIWFDKILLFV